MVVPESTGGNHNIIISERRFTALFDMFSRICDLCGARLRIKFILKGADVTIRVQCSVCKIFSQTNHIQ